MAGVNDATPSIRDLRREPPPFRRVTVDRAVDLSPHLRRVTFTGDELDGLVVEEPAASVRLLLPSPGAARLVVPEWQGNEFRLPDGRRPRIRTFTPRHLRTDPTELDLDIVVHGAEGASGWALDAGPGDPAAISGPGRGYTIDPSASPQLLLGDEAAIPAISQLLEAIPADTPIVAHVEVHRPDARLELPAGPNAAVTFHDLPAGEPPGTALLAALSAETVGDGARVWAAGEAAGMQRIRTHLSEIGVDRARTTVRGYWKLGRAMPG
jgi:NADPH-dependent ferric siderophore reductase